MIYESSGIRVELLLNERSGLGLFQLLEDFVADTRVGTVTIPRGYVYDGASIPRIARWLLPQCGRSSKAALLHDWLVARGATKEIRRASLGVFSDELKKANSGIIRRWTMCAFVFVFKFPDLYL